MEAIVLAGGFGTRLKQVVADVPKPMAPIAGRPFLEILLKRLTHGGYKRVILSVGYLADKIVDHFGSSYCGLDIEYVIESTPLGTGGAIRAALQRCREDHVTIYNGDTYLEFDAQELEKLWLAKRLPIIVVREVPNTSRYGRIDVDNYCIRTFAEKNVEGPGMINAGCYVLPSSLFENITLEAPFSLETDFLVNDVTQQNYAAFVATGKFIDIGIPDDFYRAQTLLK